MTKKSPKRKLIGFMAGEKGSMGKLQALGLGMAGLIGSGLLMPRGAESYFDSDYYSDRTWSDNSDNHHDYSYNDSPGTYYSHSDNYYDGDNDNGYNDWSGDWTNAPPSVRIEVE